VKDQLADIGQFRVGAERIRGCVDGGEYGLGLAEISADHDLDLGRVPLELVMG
jgi:hypothetical protein